MPGGVQRMLQREPDDDGDERRPSPALAEWLDYVEVERETLIRRLRHLDAILVKHGRLNGQTIPRRQR